MVSVQQDTHESEPQTIRDIDLGFKILQDVFATHFPLSCDIFELAIFPSWEASS